MVRSLCRAPAEDFVVAGNNTESLFGTCESFFRPDMVSQLAQVVSLDTDEGAFGGLSYSKFAPMYSF